VLYANPAAATLFGRDVHRLAGTDLRHELVEEPERGAVDEILARVLRGEPWSGDLVMVGAHGRAVPLATTWSPLHAHDDVTGALLVLEESPDGHRLAGRVSRLAAVTTSLLEAEDLDAVTTVVTHELADAAGATVGSLSVLVDDDTLVLAGIRGGRDGVASRWGTYAVSAATPAGDALRAGRTLVLDSGELVARYPAMELAAEGERSIVCLPLMVRERPVGVVSLSFPGRRTFDAEELQFLGILADNCAQAIARLQADRVAADRAEKARVLAEASTELFGSLDYESTLRTVASLVVPWFADWCAISLEQDGVLRSLAVAHLRPESEPLIQELQASYPSDPDLPRGAYQVLRTGVSELVPDVSDDLLEAAAVDARHLELLRALNFRSGLSVALKAQGRTFGVITWVTGEGGRRFDSDDQQFGEELARRAALAIDNAHLHSELRDMALRLQQAVLPSELPTSPGWQAASRYLPAGRGGAGGDFFDVLPLADGRVALFVGDVMGRGVEATSVMAQMRSAVRTLIAVDPAPEAVMQGLDKVFERWHVEQLVSLVYAVVDPEGDHVAVINAGHPAPVLLSGETGVHVEASETLILGAGGGHRSVVERPFLPGDTLLLFTDGLVERRHEDLDAGGRRLMEAARDLSGDDLDTRLERLVEALHDPSRDDDVAVLAFRRAEAAVDATVTRPLRSTPVG
jgi:serine phosphatase RsbU (regulator of sigma subunit)